MKLRYSVLDPVLVILVIGLIIWLGWLENNRLNNKKALQQASELNNQGSTYYKQGQYAMAILLWQKSLAIREEILGKEHLDVALYLNDLAEPYRAHGDYAHAEPLFQRSLAIREKVLGKEHPNVAVGLNDLADIYYAQGDYARAEPLYQRALVIDEKVFDKEYPNVASLIYLANRYHLAQDDDNNINVDSLLYLRGYFRSDIRTESLFVRIAIIRRLPIDLDNLAELYKTQGDYARAEPLYQRALAIREKSFGKESHDVAISLDNLAELYKTQGDYARAEPLLKRMLAIHEKIFPHCRSFIRSLNNLAEIYKTQGDYARAELLYQRAIQANRRRRTIGTEHPEMIATSLNNLATLYRDQGDSRAEPLYQRALTIAEHSGQPELLWRVQDDFSRLLAKQNKPAVAIFFGKKAVNTIQKLRANVTQEFQKSFLKDKIQVYKDLADLLIDQGRLSEAEQVLDMLKEEEYFDFIRRSAQDDPRKTQIGDTILEQPWTERYNAIHTQLAGLGREMGTLKEEAKRTDLTPAEKTRYQQLEEDLAVASQAFDAFLTELDQAFKEASTKRADEDLKKFNERLANFAEKNLKDLEALQSTLRDLGAGVVLVTYLITEDKLRMILTTPEVQIARDAPVKENDLNAMIVYFRDSLSQANDSSYRDTLIRGQQLYDWLINPIANDLAQAQAKVLMVSLDGALRYIPLAALYDGEHYLAEKYAVVMYTAAATDKLKDRPVERWKLMGLGVTKGVANFSPLPNVEKEFRMIVRRSPNDQEGVLEGAVYLDQDFTAERLSDVLRKGYPVIHIASHFRFSPTGNDTSSFLLLGDGNKLTLADIGKRYKFPDVDLLTLSACETAVGTLEGTGKEIEGLGVLAQRKGAKGVLATLWKVDDSSTALLMKHFYQTHGANTTPLNKALALQSAQKLFIEGKEVQGYRHPYYWAPFILMGNWL